MKKLFVFALFLATQVAFAYTGEYRIGLFRDLVLDVNKPTHIIVVGSAVKEDSDQFFQSGLSRAIRYKEVYPNNQVVIMSSPEVVDRDDDRVFSDFQINVTKTVKDTFYQENLIAELGAFSMIQSLDFFGHSSPWGLKLGKKDSAFDPTTNVEKISALKSHFMKNAYATLNSCNSGFLIAPKLSELLGIPVSGTLTSGLFERIESDGHWYKEDDSTKSNYVEANNFSYKENYMCHLTGACTRMKPSRYSYSSYWGEFKEGLSFPKFFCRFENLEQKCEKGMAMSLLTFPSVYSVNFNSTPDEFKKVAFDWLCQTSKDKTFFDRCVKGITDAVTRGDLIYKSHTGPELVCDFNGCQANVKCVEKKIFGSGPRAHSCKLEATTNDNAINAATEFQSFLKGFNLVRK